MSTRYLVILEADDLRPGMARYLKRVAREERLVCVDVRQTDVGPVQRRRTRQRGGEREQRASGGGGTMTVQKHQTNRLRRLMGGARVRVGAERRTLCVRDEVTRHVEETDDRREAASARRMGQADGVVADAGLAADSILPAATGSVGAVRTARSDLGDAVQGQMVNINAGSAGRNEV